MGAGICKWGGLSSSHDSAVQRQDSNKDMFLRSTSYHEIQRELDPSAKCPQHHKLKSFTADTGGFHCDMCGANIEAKHNFLGCRKCSWDKCQDCHENGLKLEVGKTVQVIHDFTAASSSGLAQQKIKKTTVGVVTEKRSAVSGDEGSVCIKFSHHFCLTMEAAVQSDDLHCLVVIDEPAEDCCLIGGLTIICTLFLIGMLYHESFSFQLGRFIHWSKSLGIWAAVLITVIASILPVIMLPVFPIMALSGPLFTRMSDDRPLIGGSIAFGCTFTGLWLGSVIAFALGKSFFKDFANRAAMQNTNLRRLNKIVERGGSKIVFMARALPILPAEVFDYACSVTSLEVYQYAIGCLGSAFPVAFWTFSTAQATVAANQKQSKGSTAHHIWLIVLNICVLASLTALIIRTIQTEGEDEEGGNGNEIAHSIVQTNSTVLRITRQRSDVSRTLSSLSDPVREELREEKHQ